MGSFTSFYSKENYMKNLPYAFAIFLFLIGCRNQNVLDPKLSYSIQRLYDLNKNKTSDTLLLASALDSAYQIAEKISNLQHDSLFAAVSRLYGNELYFIDGIKAESIYQKGLSIGLRQLPPTDNVIFRLYNNTAQLYYGQHDFKKALTYFDSIKINSQAVDAQAVNLNFLGMIAECYMYLNDPISAERVMSDIEPTARKFYSPQQLIPFLTKYARYLERQKKYEAATQKANLGDSIVQSLKKAKILTTEDSTNWADNAFEYAHICLQSKDFQRSEYYNFQALNLYDRQVNLLSYLYTLRNMGLLYYTTQRFDKADEVLTKALKIANQPALGDAAIRLQFGLFDNRSEVYLETKQYKKAIADHDSAIYCFNLYEKKPSLTAVMMQARPVLLSVLADKAKIYALYAENGQDTEGYQKALKLTEDILKIADDIRADYFSDDAKLTLANDIKPALEKAISVCQKLYQKTNDKQYLAQAFGFVEYSRSMVLYENARLDNQLPPALKAENAELKKREAALIAKNNIEDLQAYLRIKRQFREKIKALNRNQLATIADIQKTIIKDDKTALIEFFMGDSSLFIFSLIKNDLTLSQLKKPINFDKQIENLRSEITQINPVRDAANFDKQSKYMYNLLLNNTISQLSNTVNQLIIAPDGVLNYLPFDILIKSDPSVNLNNSDNLINKKELINSNKKELSINNKKELINNTKEELIDNNKKELINNNKELTNTSLTINHSQLTINSSFQKSDFLVKHYQISYAYSANLLLKQKRIKTEHAPERFAGFASKYANKDTTFAVADVSRAVLTREGAYELKGAKEEVTAISDLLGGTAFVNESATEGAFKTKANRYKILHFAMHSLTDDKDPAQSKLLFTLTPKDTTNDNDLTAAELYTTSLKADLAVLSACNTGFGTLNKGEGVMSLARAFTYAGVPSTVTSLWKVPDLTTREIMVAFYKNLKLGMTKDAALRQAKLTYLENAPESIAANPYFWAGFIPMGNMDAMDLSDNRALSKWGILAGLMGILSVGFWFWKKRF
jgi:CHAT domain-containing protein